MIFGFAGPKPGQELVKRKTMNQNNPQYDTFTKRFRVIHSYTARGRTDLTVNQAHLGTHSNWAGPFLKREKVLFFIHIVDPKSL